MKHRSTRRDSEAGYAPIPNASLGGSVRGWRGGVTRTRRAWTWETRTLGMGNALRLRLGHGVFVCSFVPSCRRAPSAFFVSCSLFVVLRLFAFLHSQSCILRRGCGCGCGCVSHRSRPPSRLLHIIQCGDQASSIPTSCIVHHAYTLNSEEAGSGLMGYVWNPE